MESSVGPILTIVVEVIFPLGTRISGQSNILPARILFSTKSLWNMYIDWKPFSG